MGGGGSGVNGATNPLPLTMSCTCRHQTTRTRAEEAACLTACEACARACLTASRASCHASHVTSHSVQAALSARGCCRCKSYTYV